MKSWIFGLMCALSTDSTAHAQENLWKIQTSDDRTVVATVAMDHAGVGGTIVTLLNIGFNAKRGCRAELGFAILKSGIYGEVVGKQSPPRTQPIMLMVDGARVVTPAPILVKYDNGWEAVSAADSTIVQSLSTGTTATVRILSGTPSSLSD